MKQFDSSLRNLLYYNHNAHNNMLKDVAASIKTIDKKDVQEILEVLLTTHDLELQIKLFSVLAAILVSNNNHNEIIITCKPLYKKIEEVICRGLPLKTKTALNLISALLTLDNAEGTWNRRKSLAMFARNVLRVSGCLAAMCHLCSNSMMYEDTWIALCHSLAEVCRGSHVNQNYSLQLVPLCVQRCRQGDMDAGLLLQSLLENNDRNIKLFLDRDGISIFTREMLKYNMGMQLLNTIVQKSPLAISYLQGTNVASDLLDLLHLYGPYSQMGQWATIILYHLDPRTQNNTLTRPGNVDAQSNINEDVSLQRNITFNFSNSNHKSNIDDTTTLFQNVMKEVINWETKNKYAMTTPMVPNRTNYITQNSVSHYDEKNLFANASPTSVNFSMLPKVPNSRTHYIKQNVVSHCDDNDDANAPIRSNVLFSMLPKVNERIWGVPNCRTNYIKQNVVSHCDDDDNANAHISSNVLFSMLPKVNERILGVPNGRTNYIKQNVVSHCNDDDNATAPISSNVGFSMLPKDNERTLEQYETIGLDENEDSTFSFIPKEAFRKTKRLHPKLEHNNYCTTRNIKNDVPSHENRSTNITRQNTIAINASNNESAMDLKHFKPFFVSTPKRETGKGLLSHVSHSCKPKHRNNISRKPVTAANRITKQTRTNKSAPSREIKNLSMSARLVSAFNESCTILLKSVTNLFKAKKVVNKEREVEATNEDATFCSYSFTKYMHRRDSLMGHEYAKSQNTDGVDFSPETTDVPSCKTCNDTVVLQHKLATHDDLKRTVKKLKFGINLYGCDFKKISKTLWRNERHMTPSVLYNLYRKLIVKK